MNHQLTHVTTTEEHTAYQFNGSEITKITYDTKGNVTQRTKLRHPKTVWYDPQHAQVMKTLLQLRDQLALLT